MADTTAGATQVVNKVEIDTTDATASVEQLSTSMKDMAVISKAASEGITHIGDEYQFANQKLQGWYDNLKKLHLEHNQTTVDLIDGMQKSAAATKLAATASEDHGKKVAHANEGILDGLHHQKLAFEDLGRIVEGENFSIRNIATNFGLLGTAGTLAIVALDELLDVSMKQDEAFAQGTVNLKEYGEALGKAAEKIADTNESVHKMSEIFKEAQAGVVSKEDALKQYNKTFGDTLGHAKDYNEAEALFNSKTDAYVSAMKQRAIADAAYGLAKENITKQIKDQATLETSFWQKIKIGATSIFEGSEGVAKAGLTALKDNNEESQKLIDNYNKMGDAATLASNKIAKAAGIDLEGGKGGKKTGAHDNSLEEQKRYLAESQKIAQDAETKEIISENIKYEKIREDLVKHHHSTEELEEQHLKNVAAIKKKYADEEAEFIAKTLAKARVDADKADQALTNEMLKQSDERKKKEQAAEDKSLREIAAANMKAASESIKANKAADQQIVQSQTMTYGQKLAYLKKDLDSYKETIAEKGVLTQEDQQKQQDDLQAYKTIQAEKAKAQQMAVNAIASTLNSAAELVGKNTALGKDIAIAAATISAIQGAISAFTAMAPIPIIGPALGVVAAAAALAAGFAQIKKIEAVKVPGAAGSGSASSSSGGGGGLPSAPNLPTKTNTTNLSANSISQINSNKTTDPIKAVVVERDMTNSQQRVQSYRSGSSI